MGDLNEGSFHFAALNDFCAQFSRAGRAPIVPTLHRERRDPWDASIEYEVGQFIFLQFKAARGRLRRSKHDRHGLQPLFYEFEVRWMPSDQHNKMRRFALMGNEIYYVAPLFHTEAELHSMFERQAVVENSIAVDPKNLPKISEHGHCFCYKNNLHGLFCSDPIPVDAIPLDKIIYNTMRIDLVDSRVTLGEQIDTIGMQFKESFGITGVVRRQGFREAVNWISSTLKRRFDTETIIVPASSIR